MEQIFKDNPNLDVAYKTADGKYFFLESDARNHASALENKKVEKVTPRKGEVKEMITEIINETLNAINEVKTDLKAEEKNDEPIILVDEEKEATDTVVNSDEVKEDAPIEEVSDEVITPVDEAIEAADEAKEEPATKTNKKTKTKK